MSEPLESPRARPADAATRARLAELEATLGRNPRTVAPLLAALLDTTPDMIFMKDRELRTTMCNASFARALGKQPRDVVGRTDVENGWDSELVHGNPAKGIRGFEQDDREALAGRVVHNPHDPANVAGEVRIFDTHKLPVRDAEGEVAWVLGLSRDITERTRAADALRRSEAQFRAIIDVSPVPYALNDEQGNITYLNPAFVRTYGYEMADIPTLDAWWPRAYPDPAYRQQVATRWQAALEEARRTGVEPPPMELEVRCKDGSRRTVLVSAARLGPDFGGVHLVILIDITERLRVEEERRELEQRTQHAQKLEALGILAGGIAHDFNNMLQGILGHAELALAEPALPERVRSALEVVAGTARSCAGLTRQMLAYAGRGQVEKQAVSLPRLVEEMRSLLLTSVPKKAALELRLPERVPAILADPSQVRQVVLNLVINAGEAIEERSGRVTLEVAEGRCPVGCPCREVVPGAHAWPPRDVVTLTVSDTGAGMDDATRKRVFEPFFSTKFSGRGLGLAAVLGIARAHGAGILVRSAPGQGACFAVHFPAHAQGAGADAGEAAAPARPRWHGPVVFADDEEVIRGFGREVLVTLGFEPLVAADGREALDLVQSRLDELRCVVLDLTMPRLDGAEAHAAIRRLRPDLPIVLASGYGEETIARQIAADPRCRFLNKPYTMSTLAAAIRQLLES